jgi:hypothetical protein
MLLALTLAALLHPVHETVSEIEWNPKTGRLEVALRLDTLDEQWVREQMKGEEDEFAKWAIPYLRQKFRISELPKRPQDDHTRYRWIGRDEEGSHVWWYFEIQPEQSQRPSWIDVRLLLERERNYTNRILILDQVPRRSLTLTIQRPKAKLNQAADAKPTAKPPIDRRSRLDRR